MKYLQRYVGRTYVRLHLASGCIDGHVALLHPPDITDDDVLVVSTFVWLEHQETGEEKAIPQLIFVKVSAVLAFEMAYPMAEERRAIERARRGDFDPANDDPPRAGALTEEELRTMGVAP